MAGNSRGELFNWPSRYLHVKGKLGFHAPFLSAIPGSHFDRQALTNAFRAAQVATQELIDTFSEGAGGPHSPPGERWVKASIFQLLLTFNPDELFLIDTVDKAGRWGIDLYGHRYPRFPAHKDINFFKMPCWNNLFWTRDSYANDRISANGPEFSVERVKVERQGSMVWESGITFRESTSTYCIPGGTALTAGKISYILSFLLTFYTEPSHISTIPATTTIGARSWMGFPPSTSIVDLAR
jgi:hypothetical protein